MITIVCQYFKKYNFLLSRVESNEVLSGGSHCNPLIALYNINHSRKVYCLNLTHNIYCHRLSIYSFSTSFLSRLLFLSIDKARINAEEKNDKAIKVSAIVR